MFRRVTRTVWRESVTERTMNTFDKRKIMIVLIGLIEFFFIFQHMASSFASAWCDEI